MRLRIWHAFASNNSGSYTLVGTFRTPAEARAVAERLRSACERQGAFMEDPNADLTKGPLYQFFGEAGVTSDTPESDEGWPQYGPGPFVEAVGHDVLVHAPYTVTMPRLLGAYLYRMGGRVAVELDHAHESLIAEMFFWRDVQWPQDRNEGAAALRAELEHDVLPRWIQPPPEARGSVAVEPVFRAQTGIRLLAVFPDLIGGVRAVRDAAERHGFTLMLRVIESPVSWADPLIAFRSGGTEEGAHEVVLWRTGEDRIGAMKVYRSATGVDLAQARGALVDLPIVVVRTNARAAHEVVAAFRAVGADAEVLGPEAFVRG